MLNTASFDAVAAATWRGPFMRPLYESYCFSNIPATVKRLLTGEGEGGLPDDVFGDLPQRADAVVVFFIDALGWRFIEPRLAHYPFLKHMADNGVVSKITSMFPSTTSAHVTCIHTGLAPAQSGVYEWFQYEPSIDRIISPLLFAPAGDAERDTLLQMGLQPGNIFPPRTIYSDLKRSGVKSFVFQGRDIVRSAPTRHLSTDATTLSYRTLPEALVDLTRLLRKREQPSYYFLYFSAIDTICHEHGPASEHVDAEIDAFLTLMNNIFLKRVSGVPGNVLFMLTADHGQTEVDPKTTVYLNHSLRGFKHMVAQGGLGNWLTPAGSPRDYFLHIRPERLDEAQQAIGNLLTRKALVVKTAELIDDGFFGPQPSDTFLKRVGNLVVLPYKGESVYYFERDKFDNHFFAHHGGLTRDEMEIPLLVTAL